MVKLPGSQSGEAHWVPSEGVSGRVPATADPHLLSTPERAGIHVDGLMGILFSHQEAPVRHSYLIDIDMGKDIPCNSRWTNGKLRPMVPKVWSSVCLGREALEQSSRSMTDAARDLPGLEADSLPERGQTVLRS